jgi:hypothetical protein
MEKKLYRVDYIGGVLDLKPKEVKISKIEFKETSDIYNADSCDLEFKHGENKSVVDVHALRHNPCNNNLGEFLGTKKYFLNTST